jgi:hypothetical protein
MELNGEQRAAFTRALLAAFPSRDKLQQMVSYGLNENIAHLTTAADLQQTVFELISWAEATNRTSALLHAALTANPTNTDLHKLTAQLVSGETLAAALLLSQGGASPPVAPAAEVRSRGPRLTEKLAEIGIADLWSSGDQSVAEWRALRTTAQRVDLLSISARAWIYGEAKNIEQLLLHNQGVIRIIQAQPGPEFTALRENREDRDPGTIDREIEDTVKELIRITKVVAIRGGEGGGLEVRYCVNDITCRIEIIDDKIIHWIPHILPARAVAMPAFLLEVRPTATAARLLVDYFALLWRECANAVAYRWPS